MSLFGPGESSARGGAARTSLLLLVGLRLALMMAVPADALFHFGDFSNHFNVALWSVPGHCPAGPGACWPLLDFWYEYPPLFGYLSALVLRVVGLGGAPAYEAYAYGLALVMLGFDVGNFILLRRLAAHLHPPATVDWIGWVYALMPAPLILGWWSFDAFTTFWMLLGLWALLEHHDRLSAVAIALGMLTKLMPALLLTAVWRARSRGRAAAMSLGVAAVAGLILLPFSLRAPNTLAASLKSQFVKSSSGTVWALIDGNVQTQAGVPITGSFGPLIERFDLSRAGVQLHNPARLPGWLTALLLGASAAYVWLKAPGTVNDRRTVLWVGFTWAIVMLWSRNWSTQWQLMLLPLILLIHPDQIGVLLALALAAVSFLEWPLLLSRGMGWGYWVSVPIRSALLAGWAIYLGRCLLQQRPEVEP